MQKENNTRFEQGFSLIELMVVSLLTAIIIIALYDLFDTNLKIYNIQQQTTTMNLRTRTAMEQMVTAIRTGGSNNQNAILLGGLPFVATAEANKIRVVEDLPKDVVASGGLSGSGCDGTTADGDTFDICDLNGDNTYTGDDENENGDGYINDDYEDVSFYLSGTDLARTQYEDSTYDPSGTPACIGCETAAKHQTATDTLATNVESLTFEYFQDTSTLMTPPVTGNDLYNIRMVRVTLDAKTFSKDVPTGQAHTLRLRSDVYLRNAN